MAIKTIDRASITHDWWEEMREREAHHDHQIVEIDGVLRWKPDLAIAKAVRAIDLNTLWKLFHALGLDKNTELVRSMYRGMGYSLFGYWEVFHWEINNPEADQYVPPKA